MSIEIILAVVLLGVVVSIGLGYWKDINIGVIAGVFAYIIGCFMLNMKVSAVVACWPVKIVFQLINICFLFGFATENGTLKYISDVVLYWFRKMPRFVPFAFYLISIFMGAIGAAPPAVLAVASPIAMTVAVNAGFNPVMMAVIVMHGATVGSNVPTAMNGTIMMGTVGSIAEYAEDAMSITLKVAANTFIVSTLLIILLYFFFRSYKVKEIQFEKPAPATSIQRKTLVIIALTVLVVVVPSIIYYLFAPTSAFWKRISSACDIQMVSMISIVVCSFLKLGDYKKIIRNSIPWNTIIMLGGVGMLMAVASAAGVTNYLGSIIGEALPAWMIAPALALLGGFMSFFSGGITVVAPMLIPMVPTIVASAGLNSIMLMSSIFNGASVTAISPFSTAGALIMSGYKADEEGMRKQFSGQLIMAFVTAIFVALCAIVGITNIIQ